MMNASDRKRGALLGLSVGDALGAAVEFRAPGTFEPVSGYRTGGPHGLAAGEWTDDTSMALALADSLAAGQFDPADQAKPYVSWWRKGEYSVTGRFFGIGNATQAVLARFERTSDPLASGDASEHASGNGSIVRLAPVPIRYAGVFSDQIGELARLASERVDPRTRALSSHSREQ